MIRSRACGHLANGYYFSPRPVLIFTRRVQTQPTQDKPPKDPLPPPKDPRKQPVQLRPGPLKSLKDSHPKNAAPKEPSATPKEAPATLPPNTPPTARPPPAVKTVDPVSIRGLKEMTVRDIADAESHGILTPPPPGAGFAKSTLHKMIQIGKFYFRGVKLIYTRAGIARDIKARVAAGGAPLQRWEHSMMHTQSADVKRLVPFVIIALILEEVIPLIAMWAPGMLPTTCILPSQRERIQEKVTDKALEIVASHGATLGALVRAAGDRGEIPFGALSGSGVPKAICGLLRLSTRRLDLDVLRRRRIHHHLTFVQQDDALLLQEGIAGLSSLDLVQALNDRAIISRGLDHKQQIQQLTWWLKSISENNTVARRIYLVCLMGSHGELYGL
ncbi:hypothetical protein C8F04DRAFT_1034027 [Mycena alexandri]|uniref:Letm1 RBD domain-containing protein n=1 Tax=Mycena alexandri TaxID=1745969 RepID=A0AAD6T4M6_9AGAR|nr:hypothetical protein C8F04DRAFT_1034027 [Mycena alexandri]